MAEAKREGRERIRRNLRRAGDGLDYWEVGPAGRIRRDRKGKK